METTGVFRPKLGFKFSTRSQTRFACKLSRFSVTSHPCKHVHIVPLKAVANPLACEYEENNRKFIKLGRAEWDHESLFSNLDFSKMNALGREIDALKPQVRDMFMSSKGITKKILFIYLLKTLGVAYHFNDEIVETLKECFQKIEEIMAGEDDLYTVSAIFYVFRTCGHKISSGNSLARFKENNGEFKESLTRDATGILSLYEAANMRTTTDYILDEALSFTLRHLESLAANGTCKHNILRCIQDGSYLPQHKNMEIIVAMQNISLYEQEENCDKTLLKFAKLNFKSIQLQFVQELKILTKWYKEHDIGSKLPPYYRDIIVEMNFVMLAYMELKYSRVRIMVTKLFVVQLLIDDTCDRYASLREVESLANAIERWDPDNHHAMDEQPEYLKYVVKFIFDTYQEYERELASEVGGSYSVNATIESCKTFMRANLQLAKWAAACHVPSFEEYLDVAGIEIAIHYTIAGILMGMKSRDKLVRLIATKTRVMNDMYGIEDDNRRGYVTSSVNCYKKQYGVTEEEALTKLHQMLVDIDKMMNEEMLKTISVPRDLLNVVIDCLRSVNVIYQTDDGYTRPTELIKSYIKSLYVNP